MTGVCYKSKGKLQKFHLRIFCGERTSCHSCRLVLLSARNTVLAVALATSNQPAAFFVTELGLRRKHSPAADLSVSHVPGSDKDTSVSQGFFGFFFWQRHNLIMSFSAVRDLEVLWKTYCAATAGHKKKKKRRRTGQRSSTPSPPCAILFLWVILDGALRQLHLAWRRKTTDTLNYTGIISSFLLCVFENDAN